MGTVQRDVSRKKGGGVGVRGSLSHFSSLCFSRSLPSRRTPLSEQEQANSWDPLGTKTIDQNHGPEPPPPSMAAF